LKIKDHGQGLTLNKHHKSSSSSSSSRALASSSQRRLPTKGRQPVQGSSTRGPAARPAARPVASVGGGRGGQQVQAQAQAQAQEWELEEGGRADLTTITRYLQNSDGMNHSKLASCHWKAHEPCHLLKASCHWQAHTCYKLPLTSTRTLALAEN
jgi:hypothetical protein